MSLIVLCHLYFLSLLSIFLQILSKIVNVVIFCNNLDFTEKIFMINFALSVGTDTLILYLLVFNKILEMENSYE